MLTDLWCLWALFRYQPGSYIWWVAYHQVGEQVWIFYITFAFAGTILAVSFTR